MRKGILFAIIFFMTMGLPLCAFSQENAQKLEEQLTALAENIPGEVGVALVTDKGECMEVNGSKAFPMLSVVKFHQALAACNKCSREGIPFSKRWRVTAKDLRPNTWSPMREKSPKGGQYSIAQLLQYTLEQSDNNACDILFNKVVSVAQTNTYIHSLGINACDIIRNEKQMAMDIQSCYENWTSPRAAVQLMQWFYDHRDTDSRMQFVWETMAQCQTGKARIPCHLPTEGLTIVHKTGTGPTLSNGRIMALNDVACILLPNGRHYFLAIFLKDIKCDSAQGEEYIATLSKECYEYFNKLYINN